MADAYFLPRGCALPDGSTCRRPLATGSDWQIMLSNADTSALIAEPALRDRWIGSGLIAERLFDEINVDGRSLCVFCGRPGQIISSVQFGPYPQSVEAARSFAIALRETRSVLPKESLHDAVYLSPVSRLLPTYSNADDADDQTVLGTWLTAGVRISVSSFSRLCDLLSWMPSAEVNSIVREAGFQGGSNLVRTGPRSGRRAQDITPSVEPRDPAAASGARFSLPGRPELENFFNEHIVDIIAHEEEYRRMGVEFPSAIILHGPPGCGKTFAVERLVEFLGWPCYTIDSSSIGSTYIHETSKKIAQVFDTAMGNAPSVVVMDEMEAFLANRSMGQASGTHHMEEVAEFLRRIPEAGKRHVLLIAMTNMLDSVDPAIVRRGRFDHIIEVKMPSAQEVAALLRSLLSKLPVEDGIDIDALSRTLAGRPLSDVAFVVKEAGRLAVRNGKSLIDNALLSQVCDALLTGKGAETDGNKVGFV